MSGRNRDIRKVESVSSIKVPPFPPWGSCLPTIAAIRAGCSDPRHQERLGSAVIKLLDLVSEWLWLSEWDGGCDCLIQGMEAEWSIISAAMLCHRARMGVVLGCLCRCIVSGGYMTWLTPAWPDTVPYYAAFWGGGFRPVEWGGHRQHKPPAPWTAGSPGQTAREWNE